MRDPSAFIDRFLEIMKIAENIKEGDANEAQTRLEVIDEILVLLGWSKADFQPESTTDLGEYTDYLLRSHSSNLLIVEAKRIGKSFELPRKYRQGSYQTGFLARHGGDELKRALEQAARYCNQTGTLYAAVTNGLLYCLAEN